MLMFSKINRIIPLEVLQDGTLCQSFTIAELLTLYTVL